MNVLRKGQLDGTCAIRNTYLMSSAENVSESISCAITNENVPIWSSGTIYSRTAFINGKNVCDFGSSKINGGSRQCSTYSSLYRSTKARESKSCKFRTVGCRYILGQSKSNRAGTVGDDHLTCACLGKCCSYRKVSGRTNEKLPI